jgi:uncharacterized protein
MTNLIKQNQKQIEQICLEDGITYLAVFGSQARDRAREDSDVDLLVKYDKPVGLFDLYDSQEKFQNLFHKKIDLVTVNGLKKQLNAYIQSDLKIIYVHA